nr:unnamed protein product [Callosobruchus analis]
MKIGLKNKNSGQKCLFVFRFRYLFFRYSNIEIYFF